jgi:hypothetical protein
MPNRPPHFRPITTTAEGGRGSVVATRRLSAVDWATGEHRQSLVDDTTTPIDAKDAAGRYLLFDRHYEVIFPANRESFIGRIDAQWEIADEGRGFDVRAATPRGRGLGLLGMDQRAIAVGGALRAESEPGRGTRVRFDRQSTAKQSTP